MPNILRTSHNSPYYTESSAYSSTPRLVRRFDAAADAPTIIVIIIVAALILVGVGSLWAYMTRLTTRRSTTSRAGSRVRAKLGSLRPWSSRKVSRGVKLTKTYQRFGSEAGETSGPRLPPSSYVGRFQAASALELGEGIELDHCEFEDTKQVIRKGQILDRGKVSEKMSGRVGTQPFVEEKPRFQPGELTDLFVIDEEEAADDGDDHRFTFDSEDLPSQWGRLKTKASESDLTRPSTDSEYVSRTSSEYERRIGFKAPPSQRCSSLLRNGITNRCYRHLNDSTEPVGCITCECMSLDFSSGLEEDRKAVEELTRRR